MQTVHFENFEKSYKFIFKMCRNFTIPLKKVTLIVFETYRGK